MNGCVITIERISTGVQKRRVETPLRALFTAIATTIQEIDPGLKQEVKVNKVMATIRKRFEDEEGPYQNHLWGVGYRCTARNKPIAKVIYFNLSG